VCAPVLKNPFFKRVERELTAKNIKLKILIKLKREETPIIDKMLQKVLNPYTCYKSAGGS